MLAHQSVVIGRCLHCSDSQQFVKTHDLSAFGLVVKQRAFGYLDGKHFFQRHRLRAQLHLIRLAMAAPPAFVFDRVRLRMKLDDVGDAEHAEAVGDQRHRPRDPVAFFRARGSFVHALVKESTFEREPVLIEDTLDVNQRALPGAEHDVLQPGQRQQVGVWEFEIGDFRFQIRDSPVDGAVDGPAVARRVASVGVQRRIVSGRCGDGRIG